jgi:tyrosine-protein phosphatase YwqE
MGLSWIPKIWQPVVRPADLTDIHAGLLDVTDRGTVNWGRSLRLARQIAIQGVRQAVVTVDGDAIDTVARRLPHLQALIDQNAIDLNVRVVARLRLRSDLFDRVVQTSTVIGGLNRRYVFLTLAPENRLPVAPIVEQLRSMNLTTILIAPEKCEAMRQRPSEWERIRKAGGLIQVSAASLLRSTDRPRRRFAESLIRSEKCHFIGSEIGGVHCTGGDDPPTTIAEAFPMIVRLAGQDAGNQMCHANADDLFHDHPVIRRTPPARISTAAWNRLVKTA